MSFSTLSKEAKTALFACLWFGLYILLSFFIPFSWPLYLGFLLGLLPALWIAPQAGLLTILVLTMLFERWFTLQPIVLPEQTILFYPLDAILLLSVLAALGRAWENRHSIPKITKRKKHSPLWVWLGVFWAAMAVVTVWSISQHGGTALILSGLKHAVWYALVLALLLLTVRTKEDAFRVEGAVITGSLLVLVFLVIGILRGDGLWTEFQPLSTEGSRFLAQPHAFYLAFGSLFLLARLPQLSGRMRHLATAGILLQWAGIILSLTRHLWIALPLALAALFFLFSRIEKREVVHTAIRTALLGLALGLAGMLVIVITPGRSPWDISTAGASITDRVTSFGRVTEDESSLWRLQAWKAAWSRFAAQPVLGIGYGQNLLFDFRGYPSFIEVRSLHNDLYGLLVQGGVVLAAAFAALVLAGCWQGIQAAKRARDPRVRSLAIAAVSALILFCSAAFFSTYLIINLFMVLFWMLFGLLMVVRRLAEEDAIELLREEQNTQPS